MTDTDTVLSITMSPAEMGLPPLLLPLPDRLIESRERIRVAMALMKGLSRSINAYACDDEFGRPNAADIAAEELELALEALS